MNNVFPNHFHLQTCTFSVIGLSICSSNCILDFDYSIDDNLHDSDHFPIHLTTRGASFGERMERFNTEKAYWGLFRELTEVGVREDYQHEQADQQLKYIEEIIIGAANLSIPVKAGTCRRLPVPWWDDDCKNNLNGRIITERAYKRNHSVYNKVKYNRAKTICRHVFAEAKKSSWKKYVSSINCRTGLHKVWKRCRR